MARQPIYTTGGTVQAEGGIYLSRQADVELLSLCRQGKFVYILTPRQMGKSSLMVQTKDRLSEIGIRSVIIDLQGGGTNTTAEQWYLGLLDSVEEQLMLETDVMQWWQERSHLGLTRRLTQFFEQVMLTEVADRVVIFVDEIDTTLSLDFTDDFFAAIRYFYVTRSQNSDLQRLSFVLIGVATPSDLIRDPKRTPFNIGHQLDLTDFTLAEAMPLAAGLELPEPEAEQVMGWVLKWTGGHPYLTQRLCGALVANPEPSGSQRYREADVAQVVNRTFLGTMSEQDNNLQFVRDMLTKRAPDIFEVLTIYQAVRRNRSPVIDEEQSIVKSHLKLSGVVKREGKALKIRNQIYRTVFDDRWVNSHFPINWAKRLQRAAVILIGLVLFSSVPLAGFGWWQAVRATKNEQEARKNAKEAEFQRQKADEQAEIAKNNAAKAQASEQEAKKLALLAQNNEKLAKRQSVLAGAAKVKAEIAQQEADRQRAIAEKQGQIAVEQRDEANQQRAIAQNQGQIAIQQRDIANKAKNEAVQAKDEANKAKLAQSLSAQALALRDTFPQRSLLLAIESIQPGILRKTDATGLLHRLLGDIGGIPLAGHEKPVVAATFAPDGKWLATGSQDGTVRLWDKSNPDRPPTILRSTIGEIKAIAISSDGNWLAAAGQDPKVQLWNLTSSKSLPEALTLKGHTAAVNTLSFSPDSNWLATGSEDQTVRLWSMKTATPGTQPIVLKGHGASVTQVVFSPSGRWLATGERNRPESRNSDDFSPRLWDMRTISNTSTPTILKAEPVNENVLLKLAFSSDEKYLAAAVSYSAQVWDLTTPSTKPVFLDGPGGWVLALAFSPNSHWLAAGGKTRGLKLWNMTLPDYAEHSIILQRQQAAVTELAFTPDSHWMLTSSSDYTARKWDLSQSTFPSTVLLGHEGAINAIALSPDGKWLATASDDRQTRLWNLSNPVNNPISYQSGNNSDILAVAMSPDGKWLAASVGNDPVIRLWRTANPLHSPMLLSGHTKTITKMAFSSDGHWLASGSDDATARLWNLATANPATAPIILRGHTSEIVGMAFTPDSRKLITGSWDGDTTIRLWDITAPSPSANPIVLPGHVYGVRDLVVSKDGRKLVTSGNDGLAKVWDLTNLSAPPLVLRGHASNVVKSVAISPDGRWVGTSSWEPEYQARLWDLTAPDPSTHPIILQFRNRLFKVDFSADGRWFAAASWDSTAQLQDMTHLTQKPIQLKGHRQSILAMGFSPDSQWLATGGEDQTIRLWNPTDPTAAPIILRPGTGINDWALAFSSDSRWLVSGNWDGNVRLWQIQSEGLSAIACQTAGRNLTPEEWKEFLPEKPYHLTCTNLPLPKSANTNDRSTAKLPEPFNWLISLVEQIKVLWR